MAIEDLYARACEAVERANYDYAVELLRQVLRLEPEHVEARRLLRATARRRVQERGGSVTKIMSPFSLLCTGLRAVVSKPRKALELYEDYLEKHPDSFLGLRDAAGAAAKGGLFDAAVDIYRDALQRKPNSKRALRGIVNALKRAGQHSEAVKYLARLCAMMPRDRDLNKELRDLQATDHMTAHKMDDTASFRDLIRDKEEAERLEKSQRMAVTMDDLTKEVVQLEKELAEEPEHVNHILRLAQLYQDTGRLPEARKLLKEKRALLADNYEIREKLGDVQLAMYDRAIAAAEEALQKSPADAEARAKKEKLQRHRNAYGLQEYKGRLSEHPTDRAIQLRLGELYFDAGKHNEAIAAFQAVSQDPRYADRAIRLLGVSFMQKGQYDLALEQFERAIADHPEMDGEGKDLRYDQARAYEAMGNTEEALKVYKRIYSQDINFRDVARKVDELSA